MDGADLQATWCATLVDQWVRCGLRHVFVAPGSRSTPLAVAFAGRVELRLEVFHDERSAAFAALGAGLATGVPAAVLCTSGTAATHFHAAVVEAGLAGVPLLVLTADRPPELHGVGAAQTIDQHRLYGDAVRWFADLAPAEPSDRLAWRALAAEAWRRAGGPRPGAVHLNVGLREPLLGTPGELPPAVAWPGPTAAPVPDDAVLDQLADALRVRRGVIVAGHGVDDPDAVARLAAALGWPVLADARSRCRTLPGAVAAFDAVLRHPGFAAGHRPDAVLQLGMPPASKVLGQWLAAAPDCVHLAVSPAGLVSDPWLLGTRQVHSAIGSLADALAGRCGSTADPRWLGEWQHAAAVADHAIDRALGGGCGEPAVARRLSRLPADRHLVVSSSMPVRDLEWFGAPGPGPVVHANRGANGIDGVVATAIGVASTGAPTVALLGDLAWCHDASSLTALARRVLDLTVVVVDNDGGGIFSFLPQRAALDHERFERLFGTPHGTDVVGLARAHGLTADTLTDPCRLDDAGRPGSGVRMWRVASDREANVAEHRRVHEAVNAALDAAGLGG